MNHARTRLNLESLDYRIVPAAVSPVPPDFLPPTNPDSTGNNVDVATSWPGYDSPPTNADGFGSGAATPTPGFLVANDSYSNNTYSVTGNGTSPTVPADLWTPPVSPSFTNNAYPPGDGSGGGSGGVGDRATSTTLVAAPSYPEGVGQPAGLVLTATVTGSPAHPPTGPVHFYDGGVLVGIASVTPAGTATCTVANPAPGVHSVTAVYQGDVTDDGSASGVAQVTLVAQGPANPAPDVGNNAYVDSGASAGGPLFAGPYPSSLDVVTPGTPRLGVDNGLWDENTPVDTSLDISNGPGANDIMVDSGVTLMGGPLFGYEWPLSPNARWGWSGSMIGDATEYTAGTVALVGAGGVIGSVESVIPIPLPPPRNPYFRDSQRFAAGRLLGNAGGMVFGLMTMEAGGGMMAAGGAAEVASLGIATPVAVPVAAAGGVVLVAGGAVFVNGGYRFMHNVQNFPDGGGGGGTGGAQGGPAPAAGVRPAGYTRMQDYIPHLDNPATPPTTVLTPEQAFALQENLQAISSRTVPAVRGNIEGGRAIADATQSLQGQLNLPRFRFIDQIPGGRGTIDSILREFPGLTFAH